MKRYLLLLLILGLMAGCDDGDIIVTSFDFNAESNLKTCKTGTSNIFYIVNSDPDESISFSFTDEDFDGTYVEELENITESYPISSSHPLIYRTFTGALSGSQYFCSGTPPSEPLIAEEYVANSGGNINIIITLIDQTIDTLDNKITKEFLTRAVARNISLKNTSGEEEIVVETLHLGSFTRTKDFDWIEEL